MVKVRLQHGASYETAQFIQDKERAAGNDKMQGFVWQGAAYEGLTCDGIEWETHLVVILLKHGTVSINNPKHCCS